LEKEGEIYNEGLVPLKLPRFLSLPQMIMERKPCPWYRLVLLLSHPVPYREFKRRRAPLYFGASKRGVSPSF
jgi:hypothetical protein